MDDDTTPMGRALALVADGVLRVDGDVGLVYRTVVHPLYTYERPTGDLAINGYVRVYLPGVDGVVRRKPGSVYAHRLIWTVLQGSLPERIQINHRNAIRHDNRLSNLEPVTASGNVTHAYGMGLIPSGFDHFRAIGRATVDQTHQLLRLGQSHQQIAAALGISAASVSRIGSGEHFSGRTAPNELVD